MKDNLMDLRRSLSELETDIQQNLRESALNDIVAARRLLDDIIKEEFPVMKSRDTW